MNNESPWYRWPENRRIGRPAWFVILRRLLFLPPLLVGKCIVFVAVLGGYGWHEAEKSWNEV